MIVQKILLITGWGGGVQLLHPLQQALQQQGHQVELINIFNALDAADLQQHVELARNFDVIVGWSLGGQLATVLVNQIDQQYNELKVLVTLASNPCFVVNDTWSTAMDVSTFQAFKQSFAQDAITTLKKFGYMVCQGVETTKVDFIKLQSLIQAQPVALLKQGLLCLEQLNNVEILKNYAGQQLHIFGKQDFLVSYKVAQYFQNLDARFKQIELMNGSHGLPLFHVDVVSDKICQFLENHQ